MTQIANLLEVQRSLKVYIVSDGGSLNTKMAESGSCNAAMDRRKGKIRFPDITRV